MIPRRTLCAALCTAALSMLTTPDLPAQAPARYQVQRDTIRYELVNPFRMYWARGADTIGDRVHSKSVESHVWSGTEDHPSVRVAFQSLGLHRSAKSTDYVLTPAGRVVTIDGKPPAPGSRGDLLTPLPSAPLRVGVRWTDTTGTGPVTAGGVNGEHDEAIRTYEVTRVYDTLGTRAADVHGVGTWHMQLSFWVDSAAGRAAWLDVKGAMDEHDILDITRGRLLQHAWKMDLRGRGVPPSGAADTIAAGLFSEETMRVADTPRTRFLLQVLPGLDSAITLDSSQRATILLHTVGRDAQGITATLARGDGMVGITRANYDGPQLQSYEATWADTAAALITRRILVDGSGLRLHRSGAADTVLAMPTVPWSVADYSMQELLAPALLALPRDGAPHAFAVYRPFAGHWDTGLAAVRERANMFIVTLNLGDGAPEIVVLSPDGDYLYGENSGPRTAKRFPLGAARQARLQALFASLKSGG